MAFGGKDKTSDTPESCRVIFEKAFPTYLAMGMTYNEFYREDHTLVVAYRKAYKRRRQEANENFWLQGAYIYEAFLRVAPVLIPFSSNPKEIPYLKKPLDIFGEEQNMSPENAEAKAKSDKGFAYMQSQMIKFNSKFSKE